MTLYTALSEVPAGYGPSVVTIGNFDGVHRGHARVISRVVSLAEEHGLSSIAVSFDPHPMQVHRPEAAHHDIMGQGSRRYFMCLLGLNDYLLLNYNLEFAAQTPEEFVKSTFVDALNARFVVIGDDVRFGKNNSGDLNTMRELGEKYGFEVVVVEDLMVDENTRCSSTRIRQLLLEGDMGFPTANLELEARGLIPADGVYAGWLVDEHGNRHPSAISVGTNPTFDGIEHRQVEAHVIDRPEERVEDFNLYGQRVLIEFVKRLRPMVAYTGVEALIEQINDDVVQTREVLAEDAKNYCPPECPVQAEVKHPHL